MEKFKFAECTKCGTVHYIVDEERAKLLEENSALYLEFSRRNLRNCSNCGSSSHISELSEDIVNESSSGGSLPPILLSDK